MAWVFAPNKSSEAWESRIITSSVFRLFFLGVIYTVCGVPHAYWLVKISKKSFLVDLYVCTQKRFV